MQKNNIFIITVIFLLSIGGCENNNTITQADFDGQINKTGSKAIHIMKATLVSVNGDQSTWYMKLYHMDSLTLGTTSIRANVELDGDFVDYDIGRYITYNGEVGDTTYWYVSFDLCLPKTFEEYDYSIEWHSATPSQMDAKSESAFHPNFQPCANK